MEELVLNPYLSREAEILHCDREYEALTWQNIGKASVTIANILYMNACDPCHVEGLQLAQEVIKEYSNLVDALIDGIMIKKKEA